MRLRLDPTKLHEPGVTASWVEKVTGSGDKYSVAESGSRYVFTTWATEMKVRVWSTEPAIPYGAPTWPTLLCYRVNGEDRWADYVDLNDGWYTLQLPGGESKRVEIFTPVRNIMVFGLGALGCYLTEVEANADLTYVDPTVGGANRGVYGDSIATGMDARVAVLQGWVGQMKRGTSDPYLPATSLASKPRWKGVYSAATLYAVNDVVSYSGSTWIKRTSAAAGTTPAVGANWYIRGFLGKVTNVSHGARRLIDDCGSGAAATAFATYLVSLGLTELIITIGTNDWITGSTVATFQTAYTNLLNALKALAPTLPVKCVSMALTAGTGSREGANTNGETMDQYRTAVSNAVTAAASAPITFVNGKTILTSASLTDGLHFSTAGHMIWRQAML